MRFLSAAAADQAVMPLPTTATDLMTGEALTPPPPPSGNNFDVRAMVGHGFGARADFIAECSHRLVQRRGVGQVGAQVIAFGNDALADVDGDPARIEEHALAIFRDAPAPPEQLHFFRERVGHLHRPQ